MTKSVPALIDSPPVPRRLERPLYPFILLALVLITYCLPWVAHQDSALTLNAYDLAEWSSLPPEVRSENPVLLASLLLRIQLTLIALIIALLAGKPFRSRRWWLCALAVLILVIAQLPPFEYFIDQHGDVNYGQQFTLAVVSLIASAIALSGLITRWHIWIVMGLAGISVATTIFGGALARRLMENFGLSVGLGAGIQFFVFCMIGFALVVRYSALKRTE